jgi:hypothetical protein
MLTTLHELFITPVTEQPSVISGSNFSVTYHAHEASEIKFLFSLQILVRYNIEASYYV